MTPLTGGTTTATQTTAPRWHPRIRKRPVSFGNPALGTYQGWVYTVDDNDNNECDNNPASQVVMADETNATPVVGTVALVQVPPEQVPEGILNVTRSYRPWISHVRITASSPDGDNDAAVVIEPPPPTAATARRPDLRQDQNGVSMPPDQMESEEKLDDDNAAAAAATSQSYYNAYESAASILAADSYDQQNHEDYQPAMTTQENRIETGQVPENHQNESVDKTYLVLIELTDAAMATQMAQELHGQPFTFLDETQTCHVVRVVALHGMNGVSLLSPFFAPQPATAPSTATAVAAVGSDDDDVTGTNNIKAVEEHFNCAVCLERIMDEQPQPGDDGNAVVAPMSILTTVCNHSFHLECLMQWQDSPCPVCRYDHSGLNNALSQCNVCQSTENNYVCLICGMISCGGGGGGGPNHASSAAGSTVAADDLPAAPTATMSQLHMSHARQHYDETLHAYALDTETQHVWDFAGQGYVHRLLQNKDDGKLVEINDPSNRTSHERSLSPGLSDAQEGEVVHRKLEGFASQYYTLLKSQLEQQRIYYEGRLAETRKEYASMPAPKKPAEMLAALKEEKAQLTHRLTSVQNRRNKVLEDAVFLKSMNESLEQNKAPLKVHLEEAQRDRAENRRVLEQRLPILQDQVTRLMMELEHGFDEASNTTTAADTLHDSKPAAKGG